MNRRDFLRLAATAPLFSAAPDVLAEAGGAASEWRTYELTYQVDLSALKGPGRLWLPLPQDAGDYQRVQSIRWQGGGNALMQWDETYRSPIFGAAWRADEPDRTVVVVTRVATRDRHMAAARRVLHSPDETALYLEPSPSIPVDGIVADTARRIVQKRRTPEARARAIYEWIVDNTFREPRTRGCGVGDIKFMLESGNLGGKCADINSLFVGLARAVDVPAREFYGVRVAESVQFRSLGKAGDISKAQHCRAEFFSDRHGWVAVDPADVRKAVLEEQLALNDPKIVELRKRLFGYWEMNWVGFNHARDFALPAGTGEPMRYLMYPYAEFGDTRLDGRDPGDFRFRLSSRRVA